MKKYASLFSVLVLSLAVLWGFYDMQPISVSSADSPKQFSVDNALKHIEQISKEAHFVGSPGHKKVQQYIFNELEDMGLSPSIQRQTVINKKWFAGTTAENIIARISGKEKGKALLLLSHYDSSQHSSKGASDAGSGVATILEGVRAFLANNQQAKNDIIILISDAEELGLLGAKAFVDHHPWARDVGLVLNFEARGSGGPSYMLMETNGKNQKMISEFLKSNPSHPAANSLMYSIYKILPNDTDLTVFREEGDIEGFNFAFIGDHFDYHTAQDSFERLDRTTLQHQADYLMNTLNYFAFSDLNNFNSENDHVYVNFPIVKMIHYPFYWILPSLIFCFLLFIILVFLGLGLNKLRLKSVLIGFIPSLLSIIIGSAITFGLWKVLLWVHPAYNDILHGFTYNGYWYVAAFASLSIWLMFIFYKPFITNENKLSLFIAPIFIWLIINTLLSIYLKGAAFFILPVFIALIILGLEIFKKYKTKRTLLYAVLSIPTLYIFGPMVKIFPVGLGLKMLFVSTLFIALIFGLLLPIVSEKGARKGFSRLAGFLAIIFIGIATWMSNFSEDRLKPNSLVYIKNTDQNSAIWGTYNHVLDDFIRQKLGDSPKSGSVADAETKNKYNTRFRYFNQAENLAIDNSVIDVSSDTVIGEIRTLSLSIIPLRKVHKYELTVSDSFNFQELTANEVKVNEGKPFTTHGGTFLIYHMGNSDESLEVDMKFHKDSLPDITLNEISYDLLLNSKMKIKPRSREMMPMPFVTNDAIMLTKKLKF